MDRVKLKITGYDEASHSLLVAFASDTTKSTDPVAYPSFAFQPLTMWPDVTDIAEITKRIAIAGMHHVQTQEAKEKFSADPSRIAALKSLVGQEQDFTVSDLTAVNFQTPMVTV